MDRVGPQTPVRGVHSLWLCVAVLLAWPHCTSANLQQTQWAYASPWDAWQFRSERQYCLLEQSLAEYGYARFSSRPNEPLQFELQARRDLQGAPMTVTRVAPDWHPDHAESRLLGKMLHINGGGSVAMGDLAQQMLLALRSGLTLQMQASSQVETPADLSWRLQAVGFQQALDAFLACAATTVSVAWHELSRSRVNFATDLWQLESEAQQILAAIVAYVREDPSVTTLYIDGHTDSSGEARKNRRLSKRRADAVAAYFKKHGLDDRRLVVRYHAADYPVADNETTAGRAKNRRTTVRLARE